MEDGSESSTLYYVLDSASAKEGTDSVKLKSRLFHCKAGGYPRPEYRWTKDGRPFDLSQYPDRITQIPGEGSFELRKLHAEDEGTYQCYAWNGNGTALSKPIHLKRTWIKYFPKEEPKVVEVELGEPFQRPCNAPQSEPPPRVFWITMGNQKTQGTQFKSLNESHISVNDKGTLFFHYVHEDDYTPGIFYTCTAENQELKDYKFGNQFTLKINKNKRRRLTSVAPTEQYVSPATVSVVRGKDLRLYCFFSGYPVLTPTWYKDGQELVVDEERIQLENFGKSLLVKSVDDLTDAGQYECRFRRSDSLNRRFSVDVQSAPYWETGRPVASQNASEGQDVIFDLKVRGDPAPSFKFYKNGKELKDGEAMGRVAIANNELTIRQVRKAKAGELDDEFRDNAVYQAMINNSHGSIWANFYLNLLAFQPHILSLPPQHSAVLGSDAVIKCKVFGSPKPDVEWHGAPMSGSVTESIMVDEDGVATLIIKGVTEAAEGEFSCFAKNEHGNDEKFTKLNVREATRLINFPQEEKMTVTAGAEVRLPCDADHDKFLTVDFKWLVEGNEINQDMLANGHYRLEPDNTLVITEATVFDSTKYTCIAKTSLDRVEATVEVVVRDVPHPPYSAWSVCGSDQRSAVVKFIHTEPTTLAAPVTEFWLQYLVDPSTEPESWQTLIAPVKEPWGDKAKFSEDGDSRTIEAPITVPLSPYGDYRFRVIARNEVGDSAPHPVQGECKTAPAIPERNPAGVRAEGNTPDNLVVYWEPMEREEWNGPGFHYVVEYRETDGDDDGGDGGDGGDDDDGWKEVKVEDPYQDHVVIEDQPMFKPYQVRVAAVNDEGKAAVSPATVEGTSGQGIPTAAPQNFALIDKSATSATFKWDPVSAEDMNGRLAGYKIYHWPAEEEEAEEEVRTLRRRRRRSAPQRQEAIFDPAASTGTVYGLKPFSNNKLQIVAFNDANDGPPSETLTVRTPEGAPSPVRGLSAFPLSASEVGVVWRPPRESNGIIQGYNIVHCQVKSRDSSGRPILDTDNCPEIFKAGAEANHHKVTRLNANADYRFTVRAVSGAGDGDPNSVQAKTLPDDTPTTGAPARPGLKTAGVGEDHVNVTWVPGTFDEDDPKPIGDDHYIKYRVKGADAWEREDPEEGNFTLRIANLDPGTTYEMVSVSVTEDEEGKPLEESTSEPFYITTAGQTPTSATAAWLILLILAIIILLIILCLICLVVRNRGAKYPVSRKEREQGREPMLGKEEKGFGEYARPDVDDEKRSLTGASIGPSETDSMAEYGDGEHGLYNEDGSFIGQYVNTTTAIRPSQNPQGPSTSASQKKSSTFV